jgi:hypothetical protein
MPVVHRPGCWHARGSLTTPYPDRRTIAGNADAGNFAADREVGDAVIAAIPSTPFLARANRAFLGHAVRYLAEEAGIRQFLDIGTGIPTAGNTHEVAQAAAPDSRVVYVDNDPIVLAHARALMTSDPVGATAFHPGGLPRAGQDSRGSGIAPHAGPG